MDSTFSHTDRPQVLALFPNLARTLELYTDPTGYARPVVRWGSVSLLIDTFQVAYRRGQFAAVSTALSALGDLTVRELGRFCASLPLNLDVHLTLCHHRGATGLIRDQLLDRADMEKDDSLRRALYQHMRVEHPLVTAFHETTARVRLGWHPDLVEGLHALLENDVDCQRIAAALLPTWSGGVDELVETARGISVSIA